MTSKFHLLNPHNHHHPHFSNGKTEVYKRKKAGWEGWDPAGQEATWLPCALICPLNLPRGTERGRSLAPPPSCWLAGHEGTDWNMGMLQRTVGGTQTTHECLGTRRTELLCLPSLGTRRADVKSGSEETPSPFPDLESMGGQSPGLRDMGHLCPRRLRDLHSCPYCSEPLLLLIIKMASADAGCPVPASVPITVTPTLG